MLMLIYSRIVAVLEALAGTNRKLAAIDGRLTRLELSQVRQTCLLQKIHAALTPQPVAALTLVAGAVEEQVLTE